MVECLSASDLSTRFFEAPESKRTRSGRVFSGVLRRAFKITNILKFLCSLKVLTKIVVVKRGGLSGAFFCDAELLWRHKLRSSLPSLIFSLKVELTFWFFLRQILPVLLLLVVLHVLSDLLDL